MGCSSSCSWYVARGERQSNSRLDRQDAYNPRPMLTELIEVQAAILLPGALLATGASDPQPPQPQPAKTATTTTTTTMTTTTDKALTPCHSVKSASGSACVDVTVMMLAALGRESSTVSSLVKVDT